MNKNWGYFYLLVAILGWGLSSSFIEFGLAYLPPIVFLAIRFILAVLIISPFILATRVKTIVGLLKNRWTWVIGFSETAGLSFQYIGQQYVPAGLAALLSLLFLLIVPFLSPFLLGERLRHIHLVAVVIGLVGVVFISTEGQLDNLFGGSIIGILFLLAAASGYALYIVTTSRLSTIEKPGIDTVALYYVVLVIISMTSTIVAFLLEPVPLVMPIEAWLWILGLVLFSTIVAFLAYFKALTVISANEASVLLLLQVLLPFSIDYLFLGRSYGLWVLSGSVLILLAIFIVVKISNENDPANDLLTVQKEAISQKS